MTCGCSITEDEVRTFLVDSNAADNEFLRRTETSSDLIRLGMENCEDTYNDLPPTSLRVKKGQFPYRSVMLLHVAGFVLRSLALNYERNRAAITTPGGTNIDDKNKMQPYLAVSAQLMSQARTEMRELKTAGNFSRGWGRLGRSYRR